MMYQLSKNLVYEKLTPLQTPPVSQQTYCELKSEVIWTKQLKYLTWGGSEV
jgi:hypothetical protein